MDITSEICNTIFKVSIVVGITVILCFLIVCAMKYFVHKADLEEKAAARSLEENKHKAAETAQENHNKRDFDKINTLITGVQNLNTVDSEVTLVYKDGPNSVSIKSIAKPNPHQKS